MKFLFSFLFLLMSFQITNLEARQYYCVGWFQVDVIANNSGRFNVVTACQGETGTCDCRVTQWQSNPQIAAVECKEGLSPNVQNQTECDSRGCSRAGTNIPSDESIPSDCYKTPFEPSPVPFPTMPGSSPTPTTSPSPSTSPSTSPSSSPNP